VQQHRDNLDIRVACTDDAARIAQLSEELGYPAAVDAMHERLEALQALSDHTVLVCCSRGDVVGWMHACVMLSVEYAPLVEIRGIVVDAHCRGLGIGAALMQALETWTRAQGLCRIRVRSQMMRSRAHAFYLREGYVERKRQLVFEKMLDDIELPE
jgi:GNAT superfamily N-acetyltransferase